MDTNTQLCDYCGGDELVYELHVRGGGVHRCIRCLAIEQGQEPLRWPPDALDGDMVEFNWMQARSWYKVLSRLVEDKPILKRDPDAIGAVHEYTRKFLKNVMGEDAHKSPSTLQEADLP